MRPVFLQVCGILTFIAATLFAASAPLCAQELRGSLLVEVRDSSSAAIPAAHVVLSQENSATHLSQTTDSRGEARFLSLTPATYSIEVAATGFASQSQRIAVSIGAQLSVRITLVPESLRQSVEVYDRGPSSPAIRSTLPAAW